MTGAVGCFSEAANTWLGYLPLPSPLLFTIPLKLCPSANNTQNPNKIFHMNTMAENIPGLLKKKKGSSHQ